jgi:hypothetical protein
MRGRIKNPGTDAQALFFIETDGLPLDEKFRAACPTRIQNVFELLGLDGDIEGTVRLTKHAGNDAGIVPHFQGNLRNGTIAYRGFRYPLSQVSCDFEGNLDEWTFTNFQGRQGSAQLALNGAFRQDEQGNPQLGLDFTARQVPCDRTLQSALPVDWQAVWAELSPQGTLDVGGHVAWSPATGLKLKLDGELSGGKLALRSFPLPLDDVHALVGFDEGRVLIKRLSGRREEMTLLVKEGWADFPDDGEWRLRLVDVKIDELDPGRSFRKALPTRLRAIIDSLDPRGRLSISGMLELRGKKDDAAAEYPVTAAWDTITVYSGNTMTAGIDLKEMHGEARFSGTWDGEAVHGEGRIDLKSVKVFDYHLTEVHGPVSIKGAQLIVGSIDAANRKDHRVVNNAQRLTARFIGGLIGLDAVVMLRELPSYKARITLTDGELQRYAQTYMLTNHKLSGAMNGWIDLQGEGTDPRRLSGAGQLVISRAALYRLPVLVAIFKVLSFVPVDDTAFDEARFMFSVGGGLVKFDHIKLVGNAINLYGGGTVRFSDGATNLDFLSTMGRNQFAIPLIREILNETTKGLVGVTVRGSIKNPVAEIRPFRQIQDGLRVLFGNLESRGGGRR